MLYLKIQHLIAALRDADILHRVGAFATVVIARKTIVAAAWFLLLAPVRSARDREMVSSSEDRFTAFT
jgi:hypothetical protein